MSNESERANDMRRGRHRSDIVQRLLESQKQNDDLIRALNEKVAEGIALRSRLDLAMRVVEAARERRRISDEEEAHLSAPVVDEQYGGTLGCGCVLSYYDVELQPCDTYVALQEKYAEAVDDFEAALDAGTTPE